MTSPLVPVPDLPYVYADVNEERIEVGVAGASAGDIARVITSGNIHIPLAAAPAVAAALLAAAGSTARVIDLGGPLPEVVRLEERGGIWQVGNGDGWYDHIPDNRIMHEVRTGLAVLEARDKARAAKPAHDPAEVEVYAKALAASEHRVWGSLLSEQQQRFRERASAVLDALAAVRGTR